jgi:hypothetical protein
VGSFSEFEIVRALIRLFAVAHRPASGWMINHGLPLSPGALRKNHDRRAARCGFPRKKRKNNLFCCFWVLREIVIGAQRVNLSTPSCCETSTEAKSRYNRTLRFSDR